MVAATLMPLAPWQAAHTVLASCLPASTSAAWTACVAAKSIDTASNFFTAIPPQVEAAGIPACHDRITPPGNNSSVLAALDGNVFRAEDPRFRPVTQFAPAVLLPP